MKLSFSAIFFFIFLTCSMQTSAQTQDTVGQEPDLEKQLDECITIKDFNGAALVYKRIYYADPIDNRNPTFLFRAALHSAKAKNKDQVISTLDTAIDAGYTNIYSVRKNTDFNFIRSDNQWKQLIIKQEKAYKNKEDTFYWGLYYGLLTTLFLLNLFLFISIKEISYLYFSLLLLADAQWELTTNFSAKVYFVKLIPWMELVTVNKFPGEVFTLLLILFFVLFSQSFLKLRKKLPKLNKVIFAGLLLTILIVLLHVWGIRIPEFIVAPVISGTFVCCIIAGAVSWFRGNREARLYVFAAAVLITSIFLSKEPILFVYSLFNIGLLLFYVILTIALADKMKIMRVEKEMAQEKALEVLEVKVKERTVEVVRQRHLVEEKQKEIMDSIAYAKRIQEAILPPQEIVNKKIPENFILYKPKDIVAGDFYWMEQLAEFVYIAAADSTGHGVPGAMVSVVCSNALNRAVKEFGLRETGSILDKTRELVIETFAKSNEEVKDGMDISLIRINRKKDNLIEVQWSGAYNSLWYFTDDKFYEVKANKQPIGKHSDPVSFVSHSFSFNSPVTFYLFSDGYADQFSPDDKKLMTRKFKEILSSIQNLSMEEQGKYLAKYHEEWKGVMEQTDDVLVIGLRV